MIGVGGTPKSFAHAGTLALPLAVAIIGGEPHRFRPLIDLYREAGRRAGHAPEQLAVGIHTHGFLADTTMQAADELFPAYAATMSRIGRTSDESPCSARKGKPHSRKIQRLSSYWNCYLRGDYHLAAHGLACP
jgi:alkanesulfonate monooxygenase SsuD/methylene tetrahydromethanopterin reductase-like flavin-dependent oxidoreductase (luciferase family)